MTPEPLKIEVPDTGAVSASGSLEFVGQPVKVRFATSKIVKDSAHWE